MHPTPFLAPTSLGIFGPSQSGKTSFACNLVESRNEVFTTTPRWLLLCYKVWQETYNKIKDLQSEEFNVFIHDSLPTEELINKLTEHKAHGLIILDDLMMDVVKDSYTEKLFTTGSHHLNFSVIYLAQNIFCQGKHSRSISLNMHYIIIFKNLRDSYQIQCLGKQIFPGKQKEFMEVYRDAISKKYGYLVVDLSPHSDDAYRLRSNIFPPARPTIYEL